jgi:hypothetical protein
MVNKYEGRVFWKIEQSDVLEIAISIYIRTDYLESII